MSGKRWLALAIAGILLIVSLGFQFVTSIAAGSLDDVFASADDPWNEKVIDAGNGMEKIVVLDINGVIQDTGGNPTLFNTTEYNHRQFVNMLEKAGEDRQVEGIILRINSPGGGVVESAEIHDKIQSIQEETGKPIYASMGNTAASGGYYISAPTDRIVAHSATLTGSIGVIMQSINIEELADEFGIDFNTIKSGPYKDIMSTSREMTEEERNMLQTMVDELYDDFVEVIVNGRNMSEDRVRELGDGRVYTGEQALERDLVDDIGTLDDTIQLMKEDEGLGNASVVRYQTSIGLNQFMGMTAKSLLGGDSSLLGIKELLTETNSPRAMYLYTR